MLLNTKIADGIWVGNSIPQADISAIINLHHQFKFEGNVTVFDFTLPDQELMPGEIPKTITRLESIARMIKELRDNAHDVLIICNDGRNKCILVAGYWMITRGGMKPSEVINFLETIYFTPGQRDEERIDNDVRSRALIDGTEALFTAESLQRQAVRRDLKCLTMRSFRSVLKASKK